MNSGVWVRVNSFLDRVKRVRLLRLLYCFPGAPWLYHFSLALVGALLCGFPSRQLFVIGVTGTKGKSTVVELMRAALTEAGRKTAALSSVYLTIGETRERNPFENTQPGRFFIQDFLRRAARAGCSHVVLEVTSQGVIQSRHRFIRWSAGILLNLTPEHIEAHGTFERYRDAKLAFIKAVAHKKGIVFINSESPHAEYFIRALPRTSCVVPYSRRILEGLTLKNRWFSSNFNQENAATVVAVSRALCIPDESTQRTLDAFSGLEGRFEFVQREPFAVVVDYAHTPESLEAIYKELKSQIPNLKPGRLICVLGAAGGGRDRWKRPAMGRIAAEYCDHIILTNEDPYDDEPEAIVEEIASGCSQMRNSHSNRDFGRQEIQKILDRREAIKAAIGMARPGDTVILTGKGSEQWIHIAGGKKIPWDERGVVEETLHALRFRR